MIAHLLAAPPSYVDITWMSIANIHYEIGPSASLTDGYITRIPESEFLGGGGGYAHTNKPWKPDVAAISRVLDAIGGPDRSSCCSPATATGIILSTPQHGRADRCAGHRLADDLLQVMAENLPAERCTPVYGLEEIAIAEGVTMRVVRWNHSGDPAKNWEQHDPVELESIPRQDPATGGLKCRRGRGFSERRRQSRLLVHRRRAARALQLVLP